MEKDTRPLFQITEAAHACGLSRSTLLRMEEKGLLAPAYIAPDSGRRYYDNHNVARVLQIEKLKAMGLGTEEIAGYFAHGGEVTDLLSMLEERLRELSRGVEELRLRAGHPMTVLLPRGEQVVGEEAVVTQGDIELLCDTVTGYSRYAAAETMARGYITAKGGFRIGLCGTAVVQEGRSTNLRSLSSACVRIAREMPGLADDLAPQLFQDGAFRSTLIIAPPGLGKTTLLRDLVRCLSDGAENIPAHRVALVDERGEVAVMVQGMAQMEIGCHTDVMDGCPKAVAIPMLLRSANPQIIALDEITQAEDLLAMEEAAHCGVRFVATIHADSDADLQRRPLLRKLQRTQIFEKAICIQMADRLRRYRLKDL